MAQILTGNKKVEGLKLVSGLDPSRKKRGKSHHLNSKKKEGERIENLIPILPSDGSMTISRISRAQLVPLDCDFIPTA